MESRSLLQLLGKERSDGQVFFNERRKIEQEEVSSGCGGTTWKDEGWKMEMGSGGQMCLEESCAGDRALQQL